MASSTSTTTNGRPRIGTQGAAVGVGHQDHGDRDDGHDSDPPDHQRQSGRGVSPRRTRRSRRSTCSAA